MFRSYGGQYTVMWRQRRTVHRRTVIWRHTATVHGRPDSRAPRPNQLPRPFSLVLSSHSQTVTLKVLPLSRQFIATIGTFEATRFLGGFEPPTFQLVARRYVDYAMPTTLYRLRYADYAVPTTLCRLCYTDYATLTTVYRVRCTDCPTPTRLHRLRCFANAVPTTVNQLRYTGSDKERTQSEEFLRLYQTRRCYIPQDRNFSRILTVWGKEKNSQLDNFRFFFEHRIMNFLIVYKAVSSRLASHVCSSCLAQKQHAANTAGTLRLFSSSPFALTYVQRKVHWMLATVLGTAAWKIDLILLNKYLFCGVTIYKRHRKYILRQI